MDSEQSNLREITNQNVFRLPAVFQKGLQFSFFIFIFYIFMLRTVSFFSVSLHDAKRNNYVGPSQGECLIFVARYLCGPTY